MWIRRVALSSLVGMVLIVAAAGSASAQNRRPMGLRAGISVDPEQFYFGGHMNVGEIVKDFVFRPNIEVGVGDGVTLLTFNGEFVYMFPVRSREWRPYAGGGPGLVIANFRSGPSNRDTDAGPGFNFVGGVQQRRGFMAEIKIGVLDSPDFKLGVGWTW
jgi:hypothetical protein